MQAKKNIDDYNAEALDRISEALYPRQEGDVDTNQLVKSLEHTAQAMMSTADFHPSLEMVQFLMIQNLCDMAYNKGCAVLDRLQELNRTIHNKEREADGSEFFEDSIDKLMWRKRQLELQHWYWQRAWQAWRKVYVKTVMVMKAEGTYQDIPDDWLPPHIRYANYDRDRQLQRVRRAKTAGAAIAKHNAA
jgi:hypothetical protein